MPVGEMKNTQSTQSISTGTQGRRTSIDCVTVRKELPMEEGIGEHTTCTLQPYDDIFFIDAGWVVEGRAFQKDGRQYLFLCECQNSYTKICYKM